MGKKSGYSKTYRLFTVWLLLHFLLFFLLFYPLFLFYLAKPSRYPKAHRLRRIWGQYILFFSGIRVTTEYEEELDPDQTYILAPNHSSYLDIPAITVGIPIYFNFMAKDELRKVPLFGHFFKTIDIAVDRKKAVAAHRAFLEAGNRIDQGVSLCLFPEGTIPPNAPDLGRFKDGAFRLAIEKQIPIVPITQPDNHYRLPDDGSLTGTPGKMRVFVHRPIQTVGLKLEDLDQLKKEVFSIIESKLAEYANHE